MAKGQICFRNSSQSLGSRGRQLLTVSQSRKGDVTTWLGALPVGHRFALRLSLYGGKIGVQVMDIVL